MQSTSQIFGSLSAAVLLTYTAAGVVIFFLFKKRSINRGRFHRAFKNALFNGSIESLPDVKNLADGIYNANSTVDREAGQNDIAFLLRRSLALFNEEADTEALKYKGLISKLIRECEILSPYADLPAEERGIFTDIAAYLRTGSVDDVHRKLTGLVDIIKIKRDQFDKLEKQSKWANPLALLGILVSVVFGIASLIK